jgi:DNA-binding transcriptional LysR family regulator
MAMIDRVSHRLKLRDLRLLQAVVQWKSMAKAATHLNLTQPAVSKAIGELEHTLGVKLLDRNREGIEPTAHGLVLLKRGVVMFDELRQGISEIEYLSDPTAGAVRLAAAVTIAAGILPIITDRMSRQYPRISLHAKEVPVGALQFHARQYPDLRERAVDLVLAPIVGDDTAADLDVEPLFGDPLLVATGSQNRWVGRRGTSLQDLFNEPWCLPPADSVAGHRCIEAFRLGGLDIPPQTITTISAHLQIGLLATQRFFTMFPGSLMRFSAKRFSIKALPLNLAVKPMPVGILTLKGRTVSPAAQLFIQTAREVAKPLANARGGVRSSGDVPS